MTHISRNVKYMYMDKLQPFLVKKTVGKRSNYIEIRKMYNKKSNNINYTFILYIVLFLTCLKRELVKALLGYWSLKFNCVEI